MKKKLVKVSIILGIVILTLVAAGMIMGVMFGDKIKELAVRELNKRLATEVKVNGPISFSVFSNFPYASITFSKVEMKESLPEKNDLISCERISLLFNIIDVFRSNYSMKKVIAENGQLSVHINNEGKNNYDIFKPSEGNSGKAFSLKIAEADLLNIMIHYDDDRSGHHYVFETKSATMSGDFSSDNFLLNIQSDLLCKQLKVIATDYLPNRNVTIDGALQVDLVKNLYTIQDAKINVEGNQFLVSGNVLLTSAGNQLDLHVAGNDLRMEEVAALLPSEYADYFSHFKSKGVFQFNAGINGLAAASSNPHVDVTFGVKNGTLSHDQLKESFEQLNLSGSFSNGSGNNLSTSFIQLKNLSTSFAGNVVNGTLLLSDFRNLFLDMKLNGKVSLEKIAPLFPSDYIRKLAGDVTFQQFYFKGNMRQLATSADLQRIEAGGSFTLKDVTIGTDNTDYEHLNGAFDIRNNQITINELAFKARQSDVRIQGTINNFIPYLLTSLNDSVTNHQKIGINVKLISSNLSWIDLVGKSTGTKTPGMSNDSYYSIPSLFYVLTGSVSGRIEKFSYEKFNADAVHGNILFMGNNIYFNDFGMNAEQGSVQVNGKLDITNAKRNRLELTATLNHLDITQLFYEMNNFSQSTLTDKNLKGIITSQVALQATWMERKFDNSKLYAVADVTVENGELNNFEPMMALAKFVKISELKNIRFSKMQNQVEIKNQKIYIPGMQIFSTALNVQLSGNHSFDNMIDYKVQLNLLKLLTSKFEKTNTDPDAIEKTTEGFLNLYLSMTGPASNPVIKYDTKAVKAKIAADLKNEKNELKGVLKKEFDQQEQTSQEIKDWKAPSTVEYMEFQSDTLAEDNSSETESATKQNQKKEFDNFKNIFKPKTPPKQQR